MSMYDNDDDDDKRAPHFTQVFLAFLVVTVKTDQKEGERGRETWSKGRHEQDLNTQHSDTPSGQSLYVACAWTTRPAGTP